MDKSELLIGNTVCEAFFDLGYYVFDFESGWMLTVISPIAHVNEDSIESFIGLKVLNVEEENRLITVTFSDEAVFEVNICRSIQPNASESMVLRGPNYEIYTWHCKDPT